MTSDPRGTLIENELQESPVDRRFLRALFIDLTGRTPLPREAEEAFGTKRIDLIERLVGSVAFFEGLYEEELFYFLLIDNFRPSTEAFVEMPGQLEQQKLSVKDALRQIVSSQFFNARNPGNDTFVTVVLEQLLGQTVQKNVRTLDAGKRMYDGAEATFLGVKGSNQADLVKIAVDHPDFEKFFLQRHYGAIFGRPRDPKMLQDDAERLRQQPLSYPRIVTDWTASLGYEQLLLTLRPKSDRVFIRSLFVDLLDRQPEAQELRRCRNALLALSDTNPLRSVLIKLMLDSGAADSLVGGPEAPEEFVRRQFVRFLCREPDPKEIKSFTGALESRACTRRTVVRAILTHPEYQSY